MKNEISIGQSPQRTNVNTGLSTGDLQSNSTGGATAAAPILGGESVKVTSGATTDLEKLVAQLKNESDEAKQTVAQRRIAILQTVLNSMAVRISETQRMNLLQLESLNFELAEVEESVKGLEAEKAAAAARSAELDAKIKALEQAIELAVEEGEIHREQVEKAKEQKEREDAKIRELTNAIASAANKISELKANISNCTAAIGAATLDEVAAAVKAAAADVKPPTSDERNADREKEEAKAEATNPVNVIRESLDAIDEDIRRIIDERRSNMV